MNKTLTMMNTRGDIVAEYQTASRAVRFGVLPARDGSNVSSADDGWAVAGVTRHPSTAVMRDCHYSSTVHVERDRLLPR